MLTTIATPLGEHSGCSYPACTSQEEILKASAPGLIPQYEKDEQVQLLKDVEFTLKEFPALAEAKVNCLHSFEKPQFCSFGFSNLLKR
jgi:hypothetical protein